MNSNCLPLSSIPHTTPLFLDFLHHFEKVKDFYARPPAFTDWGHDELQCIQYPDLRRQQVVAILETQNRRFGAGAQTLHNIQRLKEGAPAIVARQQVALFGGPIFVVLKALSAVLLAEKMGAVPVLWLATEDHDLAEVNLVRLPSDNHLETFATNPPHVPGGPVGSIVFNHEISTLLKRLEEQFGPSDMLALLQDSYRPGETFAGAFAKFYAQVFAEAGLVLLDPQDPQLHVIAAPVYSGAMIKSRAINSALAERQRQLKALGYNPQVKIVPWQALCLHLNRNIRLSNDHEMPTHHGFVVGHEMVAYQDLIAETVEHSERFTADALLQPVVQDYLLPTLCSIAGSSEISRFALVQVVYRELLGRVTPVVPRLSATMIETRHKKLLDRYEMAAVDALCGMERLEEYLATRTLSEDIVNSFDTATEHLKTIITLIQRPLENLDCTLQGAVRNTASKMNYQLQNLRNKAVRAEARKRGECRRHASELSTLLYPGNKLQEQGIGSSYFLLKYGKNLIQQLKDKLNMSCFDHQVIEINLV